MSRYPGRGPVGRGGTATDEGNAVVVGVAPEGGEAADFEPELPDPVQPAVTSATRIIPKLMRRMRKVCVKLRSRPGDQGLPL